MYIDKLECVERMVAWFVLNRFHNTSCVSAVRNLLNWPNLQQSRGTARLPMAAVEDEEQAGRHWSTCRQTAAIPRSSASRRRPATPTATVPHTHSTHRQCSFIQYNTVQYNTILLPSVNIIARRMFCGAKYTHHMYVSTPITKHH